MPKQRIILYVDMDAFFAAGEQCDTQAIRVIIRPGDHIVVVFPHRTHILAQ